MEKKITDLTEVHSYEAAILEILRGDGSPEEKRAMLDEYHDRDIAAIFEELPEEERALLPEILGPETMSDIVSYMEDAGEFLAELDAEEAAEIVEQMDPDEALEALEDLSDSIRSEILGRVEETAKETIDLLDSYGDDEFGSAMSTNFIAVNRAATIKSAMRTLIDQAADNDNISTIFAVNDDGSFYGAITLKDLIVSRSGDELDAITNTNFPVVYDKDSIAEHIERLRGYFEDLIPVLSSADGRILGVITAQNITDLVDEEMDEAYARLAALSSPEEEDERLFQSLKKRIPWLVALLFMGLIVSGVVSAFENVIDALPLIVSFQSLILGMAGNVGTQSLAVTVRALAPDEKLSLRRALTIIAKETRVALLGGAALGAFSFLVVGLYLSVLAGIPLATALSTAGCVGAALCFAMAIAGLTGAAIPLVLFRIGFDPAIASGPLITTVNDLVAVISYYGLAYFLLLR